MKLEFGKLHCFKHTPIFSSVHNVKTMSSVQTNYALLAMCINRTDFTLKSDKRLFIRIGFYVV